ncbi:hypothetical protein L1887_60793 [Cichorium endivia]|nr:hypothetical protein L1887_60793 [Cichorium endivia]
MRQMRGEAVRLAQESVGRTRSGSGKERGSAAERRGGGRGSSWTRRGVGMGSGAGYVGPTGQHAGAGIAAHVVGGALATDPRRADPAVGAVAAEAGAVRRASGGVYPVELSSAVDRLGIGVCQAAAEPVRGGGERQEGQGVAAGRRGARHEQDACEEGWRQARGARRRQASAARRRLSDGFLQRHLARTLDSAPRHGTRQEARGRQVQPRPAPELA